MGRGNAEGRAPLGRGMVGKPKRPAIVGSRGRFFRYEASGFQRGQYWEPSAEQEAWEHAAREEAALSKRPPSAPRKNAPSSLSRLNLPKARSRRPQLQTPEGSVPIITPPASPEQPRVTTGILQAMGPIALGRTSPVHLCVITAWRINTLSCARLPRDTQAGRYLFKTRSTNRNTPTIVWRTPATAIG